MAVLPHEGTHSVMYGTYSTPAGSSYRSDYMARPDAVGRFPVVLITSGPGDVSSHVKSVCRFLARRGMVSLALGLEPGSSNGAHHRMGDVDLLAQLDETHRFLNDHDLDWALGDRVGVLGIGSGGRLAILAGALRSWVGPAAVLYGPLTGDEQRRYPTTEQLERLGPEVLGIYAADDDLIEPGTVDNAQDRNPAGAWLLYEGVGHGFVDENHPNYNEGAAMDAMERLAGFFASHLPAPQTLDLG
ncbi:MAG: hypothetical protein F4Y83_03090 [Acidimicrobiia bacterium]|nr:hypothetical protein [Acidimicrobiia bacterium]